jgi:hypothetical protein
VETERAYFEGLKKLNRNAAIRIERSGVAPLGLVMYASRLRARRPEAFDEVWCVVDVDDFDISAALVVARREAISLAISNPCFEFWLLLHFEACCAPLGKFDHVRKKLERHVPGYDKTKLRFAQFQAGITDAVDRAKVIADFEMEHRTNPSTGVWKLVEKFDHCRD